ncbi:bifunctional L-myo-inositol-1-phosphate cytidylyltransferase/CDP-L-myo-inositol myo-inositolphosphotransferase [Aquifex aeolicus]|uniref:Bifunctional IPC transferase and DIPP synthase n=1 Tax=Aquifex aeolicus (strain VF5) TaxID=224324 RepID=DIPPS_AQUAE|nr:bifunctional L-myo-inositol-1-phosphate cytidylyltransferase/CDP-L-myo-inositol myo-inositolphosphotransferase [Aquifex aeolicus]O67379.1 RecName: Full=Bifunctional IPC transferase and DIPP synthase; Includes: RecName: Full=1L-myo-inositol-1-phosphate cytidylyltransferase; Short=IPCT; Includes: RecName: Full=CDP-L-myo-inositol myo-inositolphosphotransferase; Short=DIPP synthase; AltName: Full=Di-myo-inositol-1,3'-phosphate-1'-phosphate synthase [Aquifex aeolicus VF5]AAC07344.1 glucose-1-phosph
MVETAVILAGGEGNRLKPLTEEVPKALLKVAGRELLYRTIKQLQDVGVKNFVIVVNKKFEGKVKAFLKEHNFEAEVIPNEHPEKENGYSLYLAKGRIKGEFAVVMSDHIYEKAFLEKAVEGKGLIVDRLGLYINKNEATKVKCEEGRIKYIGKNLEKYDGFDTGFFVLDESIFEVAEEALKEQKKLTMSELAKRAQIPCTEVSGYFWMDVDTPEDVEKAKKYLVKTAIKGVGDGFISRNLNRKVSTRISPYLVDKFTPNQLTVLTFLLGMFSALVAYFSPALGGILLQINSMLDGLDGEVARAQMRTTKFGAWLDSVLDRYVDFAFLSALAMHLKPSWDFMPWVFAALFGSVMVSYSTERYKGAYCEDAYAVIKELRYLLGKRDERIFMIMIFTILGWIKALFVVLAIITNLRVILTIYLVWKKKGNV